MQPYAQRLTGAVVLSVAVVGVAVVRPGGFEAREVAPQPAADTLKAQYAAVEQQVTLSRKGDPFMDALRSGGDADKDHDHNLARTKNALTRTTESGPLTKDPTTPEQARRATASVARERAKAKQPKLVPGFKERKRTKVPQDRYAMAGGCYQLRPSGAPYFFQATRLGSYLLYSSKGSYLAADGLKAVPSAATEWVVDKVGKRFSFTSANGTTMPSAKLRRTTGCATFPEIQTNVSRPFKAKTTIQETRGFVDTHSHGMTHEFLGGLVMCGKPWDPYGVTKALVDCPDHDATGGYGAVVETFLSGGQAGHDTVGWPTFAYWPNPHSLTHQSLYYKWLERSWRGGLRVFTNLLTENNALCELYPLKKNSCNDMDAIRLQAKGMREMQDYIDAQYGGPGRGWYRIVKDPFEARRVVNEGKLAVVMGIETSVPFDCNVGTRQPTCTKALIDKGLDEVYKLGVRQMEITNKFDNGLTGVAGDEGETGVLTNLANFYNTGSFLRMEPCDPSLPPGIQDKQQVGFPDGTLPAQDALFGAIADVFDLLKNTPLPTYTAKPHCNQAGLSDLGKHLINSMIDRGMLFDPDHMSVIARRQALDLLEQAAAQGRHPGVLSSHSWSTPDAYPRIYKLGGFVTPYAGDSKGFLEKWKQHLNWRDPRYYFGFGYGADINGFGTQGDARKPGEADDVDYPFKGLAGVSIDRQRGGQRVWDINTDGVAHYGLYPDWIEDVRIQAGAAGAAFMSDMARGAEGFLQTWERSLGVTNDGCRDKRALQSLQVYKSLKKGMSVQSVLERAGQPHTRLGLKFKYCAQKPQAKKGKKTKVTVVFGKAGLVKKVNAGRAG